MTSDAIVARTVGTEGFASRLDDAIRECKGPLVAAFDADGTLWSGDIGIEAFDACATSGLIDLERVRPALEAWATPYGLRLPSALVDVVGAISEELSSGRLVERGVARGVDPHHTLADAYAMQAWIYAGATEDELRGYGERIWRATTSRGRYAYVDGVFEMLRAREVRVVVVSASPRPFVEAAALHLGIRAGDVIAMRAARDDDGRVLPEIADLVYGPGKVSALAPLLENATLVAAFGDSWSGGDKELLEAARIGVVVPKEERFTDENQPDNRALYLLDPHCCARADGTEGAVP